ncbi:MAG: hexose kinase [Bryobacterales bacterium]|nr:hexose kinase [Bryobacterales bacterium]
MILTLTANPAIDRNLTADRLAFEDRAQILSTSESAGGRGINAARVIESFGGSTLAIAVSGGETGTRFETLVREERFESLILPIRGPSRTNLNITDLHGLTIKLNEPGPHIEPDEARAIEEAVRARIPGSAWLMLCGSMPPGMPSGLYARLIEAARKRGVQTILDTDGDALRRGIEAHPTVVFPNRQEAEELLDTLLLTRSQSVAAAKKLVEMGAEAAVLSLGSLGAVASDGRRVWEVRAPAVDAVCPIGAGDALAAAFAWASERGSDFTEAVRWGVACGTASARLPGLEFASLAQTEEVYARVDVVAVE